MRAGAFRAADYRAQVSRIAHLVAYDDKRLLAFFPCKSKDVRHLAVFVNAYKGDNALMRLRDRHVVKLPAVGIDNDDAGLARFRRDVAEGLVRLALGNENLIYAAAYAQSLDNGISALDYIVFDLKIVFLVLHFFTCAHICR